MKSLTKYLTASFVVGACGLSSAFAQSTVASNFGAPYSTEWTINSSGDENIGAEFITGSTAASLYSVTVEAGQLYSNNNLAYDPNGQYTMGIYSNNGGSPGSLLYSLGSVNGPSEAAGDVTFNTGTGISLTSNTSYWLLLSGTTGDSGYWMAANPNTVTATDGWNISTGTFDADGSTVYSDSTPFLSIQVQPVPEPGTLALAASGVAGLLFIRRRK